MCDVFVCLFVVKVTLLSNLFPALAGAAIGAASKTTSSQMQTKLLEQSKTLTESALQVKSYILLPTILIIDLTLISLLY